MNTVIPTDPLSAPHLLFNRLSPTRSGRKMLPFRAHTCHSADTRIGVDPFSPHSMSGRKRKASEEPEHDRMSTSPSASPSISNRTLAGLRGAKRTRTGSAGGRPLPLPRLLETLSADEMRRLLQNVCEQHPELHEEIVSKAPRPSIEATLSVLARYEEDFRKAFPLGNRPTSDYTYNRVRQHLVQLIDALREYTPHFLPPQETQTTLSLTYLDAATNVVHRLPDWDTYQHQRHKSDAYDEISKAWALVIQEAAKRAGGFHLQFGGWDQKLVEHNQKSGGRLDEAVNELRSALGFARTDTAPPGVSDERLNIRQQLFSGSYGQELGVSSYRW